MRCGATGQGIQRLVLGGRRGGVGVALLLTQLVGNAGGGAGALHLNWQTKGMAHSSLRVYVAHLLEGVCGALAAWGGQPWNAGAAACRHCTLTGGGAGRPSCRVGCTQP